MVSGDVMTSRRCTLMATLHRSQCCDRTAAQRLLAEATELGVDAIKLVARGNPADGEPGDAGLADIARLLESAGDLQVLIAPYDLDAFDRLSPLAFAGWKVDAPLLTHLPLLDRFADDSRSVIAAVGGCTKPELDDALRRLPPHAVLMHTLLGARGTDIADVAYMNALKQYRKRVGYADTASTIEGALVAVALGAAVIEKPLRVTRTADGSQPHEGLLPHEFRALVSRIRSVERVLDGDGTRDPAPEELDAIEQDRVTIVASRAIPRGTILDRGMLTFVARGPGLPPRLLSFVDGRRAIYDIPQGTPVTFGLIES